MFSSGLPAVFSAMRKKGRQRGKRGSVFMGGRHPPLGKRIPENDRIDSGCFGSVSGDTIIP
jgi:hypothetical protein